MSVIKSTDRVMRLLAEKRAALEASSLSYDQGKLWEAKRLANEIHQLVHDPIRGRTKSLLTQLGIKSGIRFVDSTARHPLKRSKGQATPPSPLLAFKLSEKGAEVIAFCQTGIVPAEHIEEVTFRDWWEDPIIRWSSGTLSRKNLVMTARDQDGGSHSDDTIDQQGYRELEEDLDHRLRHGGGVPFRDGHLACIRQIAWEMAETLRRVLGD